MLSDSERKICGLVCITRAVRKFFMRHWRKPTLIAFSHRSALPWYTTAPGGTGDFIIGNRRQFFQLLVR